MKALIFDEDIRYQQVITALKAMGYQVDLLSKQQQLDFSIYDVIVLPVLGISEAYLTTAQLALNFLTKTKNTVKIFSGIKTQALTKLLTASQRSCYYLMEDAQVVKENAILTVEGIIADLIINTKIAINNAKIMVLGYGNIGVPLVAALNSLGANVYVGVIESTDKNQLDQQQQESFYTSDQALNTYVGMMDMIVNTVPATLLTTAHLQQLKTDSYLLDVASKPYGINVAKLTALGIKHKIYPAIPSKVAPQTAGEILVRKISSIIR